MKDTECQANEFAINLVEKGELEGRNHWIWCIIPQLEIHETIPDLTVCVIFLRSINSYSIIFFYQKNKVL